MKNIYIAGHNGMVGSNILNLLSNGDDNIITQSKDNLDLLDQSRVKNFFLNNKIDEVYLAAAKVGGIFANNTFPATFIHNNLQIQTNVIHYAFESGVKKLLFLGSSCIYPKFASQPIVESSLLTGVLEPTNEPYAIAKIAGIKMCESYNRQYQVDFRSIMPTNLFGIGDNYHPENSHVIPALIRRFHEAKIRSFKEVVVWGTGNVRREFLFSRDMASASIFLMNISKEKYAALVQDQNSHINVGSGIDISIKELAETIAKVVGFQGKICFDHSKPDGTPRKLLDTKKIRSAGWKESYTFNDALTLTYEDFLKNHKNV